MLASDGYRRLIAAAIVRAESGRSGASAAKLAGGLRGLRPTLRGQLSRGEEDTVRAEIGADGPASAERFAVLRPFRRTA